jgi:hypothetical protein
MEKEKIGAPSKRDECRYLLHCTIAGLATVRHDFFFNGTWNFMCVNKLVV